MSNAKMSAILSGPQRVKNNLTKYAVNSSPHNAAYIRQWSGSSLVQVMAWDRTGDKPMLAYCQLDSWEHIWLGILSFLFKKMQLKMSSAKMFIAIVIVNGGQGAMT